MNNMEAVAELCEQCWTCPLGERRHNLVFGAGNPHAEVMLIGEAPGEQEDFQGVPFVGAAGKLLDAMLEMIDLDRSKVYITNIVKCRPPQNRDPQLNEIACCKTWLRQQLAIIQPKIIVCLGRIAAKELIAPDFHITACHGQWYTINGRRITALYHPSAILRDETKRPETFTDLRSLRQEIRSVCERTY